MERREAPRVPCDHPLGGTAAPPGAYGEARSPGPAACEARAPNDAGGCASRRSTARRRLSDVRPKRPRPYLRPGLSAHPSEGRLMNAALDRSEDGGEDKRGFGGGDKFFSPCDKLRSQGVEGLL